MVLTLCTSSASILSFFVASRSWQQIFPSALYPILVMPHLPSSEFPKIPFKLQVRSVDSPVLPNLGADFRQMKSYNIAVIGGDGTGPEVTREAIKVLDAASKKFGIKLNYSNYDLGGERYLKTNEALPDSAVEELRKFPAILLGAIGHPDVKPGILEKGILLRLRFELEQYINLRPVKLYDERFCPLKDKTPADIDFVVVRENNEGIYTGAGGFVFGKSAESRSMGPPLCTTGSPAPT